MNWTPQSENPITAGWDGRLLQVSWDVHKWIDIFETQEKTITVSFSGVDPSNYFTMEVTIESGGYQIAAAGLENQVYQGPGRFDTYLQHLKIYTGTGAVMLRVMI